MFHQKVHDPVLRSIAICIRPCRLEGSLVEKKPFACGYNLRADVGQNNGLPGQKSCIYIPSLVQHWSGQDLDPGSRHGRTVLCSLANRESLC